MRFIYISNRIESTIDRDRLDSFLHQNYPRNRRYHRILNRKLNFRSICSCLSYRCAFSRRAHLPSRRQKTRLFRWHLSSSQFLSSDPSKQFLTPSKFINIHKIQIRLSSYRMFVRLVDNKIFYLDISYNQLDN